MIDVYRLDDLLKKYRIDVSKVLSKNDTILDRGEYQDIDRMLDYLINELGISPRNIEKCPSIMYYAVDNIRENYEFLIRTDINISSIETALHILSVDPKALKETYYYICDNYGKEYINRITSVLKVPVSRIIAIEKVLSDKSLIISAACSWRSIDEIEKIVAVCKKNNIPITSSVFYKTADEIEEIIIVCKENNVPITGSIFHKTADELEKSIDYVKSTYGNAYLKPLIVNKSVEYLKVVLPYLDLLNVLPVVIDSASILTLSLEEIMERKEYIESIGEELVLPNGRFNSIFGLSKVNYKKLIGKKEECLKLCRK